jgi:hypothetical protein
MFDRLYCDKRNGCVAIYPDSRKEDKNGCGCDDERNIAYSCAGSEFRGSYWTMDESVQKMFQDAVDDFNQAIENALNAHRR